jgi:hypothetical protein
MATEAFVGLDLADRQVLADWLAAARTAGIETIADFTPRPWRLTGLDVVIGVFQTAQTAASWLLVRYQGRWVLATTESDTISGVCGTLMEALALISDVSR